MHSGQEGVDSNSYLLLIQLQTRALEQPQENTHNIIAHKLVQITNMLFQKKHIIRPLNKVSDLLSDRANVVEEKIMKRFHFIGCQNLFVPSQRTPL